MINSCRYIRINEPNFFCVTLPEDILINLRTNIVFIYLKDCMKNNMTETKPGHMNYVKWKKWKKLRDCEKERRWRKILEVFAQKEASVSNLAGKNKKERSWRWVIQTSLQSWILHICRHECVFVTHAKWSSSHHRSSYDSSHWVHSKTEHQGRNVIISVLYVRLLVTCWNVLNLMWKL